MVRKRRKKSKNYFTQETEDAIVLYNKTSDPKVKIKEVKYTNAIFITRFLNLTRKYNSYI